MPILNQQTGPVQEYEIIPFVNITFQYHKHFRENVREIKTVVTKGSAQLPLCKMWSCFWTETPALLTRNKKCIRR